MRELISRHPGDIVASISLNEAIFEVVSPVRAKKTDGESAHGLEPGDECRLALRGDNRQQTSR